MSYPVAPNEEERLEALLETGILKAGASPILDEICDAARHHFDVSICLVTLLDHDRQIIKAASGSHLTETPRCDAFCNNTILNDEVFVVEDAFANDRFKNNPLVTGAPHIRFYAGAPLTYMKNIRFGALCILDTKARKLSRGEAAELTAFAERVTGEILAHELERLGKTSKPGSGGHR